MSDSNHRKPHRITARYLSAITATESRRMARRDRTHRERHNRREAISESMTAGQE